MTNEQLALRIRAGDDVAGNMAALIEQMRPFCYQQAAKYYMAGCGNDLEDFQQESIMALYAAVGHYDPERGSFLTAAAFWIRGHLQRCRCNSPLRIPYNRQAKIRKYKQVKEGLYQRTGRGPQVAEIAAKMGIPEEDIADIEFDIYMSRTASIDATLTADSTAENYCIADTIPAPDDPEKECIDQIEQEELKKILWKIVDALPGKQPEVIRLSYQNRRSAAEIAADIGISKQDAVALHRKALRLLRKPERAKKLVPYLPEAERIYNDALRGGDVATWKHTGTSSTERTALEALERAARCNKTHSIGRDTGLIPEKQTGKYT